MASDVFWGFWPRLCAGFFKGVKTGRPRIGMTLWSVILPALLLTVTACAPGMKQTEAPAPARPTLESARKNDRGGICIDGQDTRELLHYLDQLEARQ